VLHILKLNYTFKIVYKKMHFFIAKYLFQNQITAAKWKDPWDKIDCNRRLLPKKRKAFHFVLKTSYYKQV